MKNYSILAVLLSGGLSIYSMETTPPALSAEVIEETTKWEIGNSLCTPIYMRIRDYADVSNPRFLRPEGISELDEQGRFEIPAHEVVFFTLNIHDKERKTCRVWATQEGKEIVSLEMEKYPDLIKDSNYYPRWDICESLFSKGFFEKWFDAMPLSEAAKEDAKQSMWRKLPEQTRVAKYNEIMERVQGKCKKEKDKK